VILKKLETFLSIFIFGWLGRKCATKREAEKSVKVVVLCSLGYIGITRDEIRDVEWKVNL